MSNITVPKFDVFPTEDSEPWSHYTDAGIQASNQPSRTRAIALQISYLCEISSDLLLYFYHPTNVEKPVGKQAELKKLSELHTRLEAWRKQLPKEMEARDGQLPNVLVMQLVFLMVSIDRQRNTAYLFIACFFNCCLSIFSDPSSNTIKPHLHCPLMSRPENYVLMRLP